MEVPVKAVWVLWGLDAFINNINKVSSYIDDIVKFERNLLSTYRVTYRIQPVKIVNEDAIRTPGDYYTDSGFNPLFYDFIIDRKYRGLGKKIIESINDKDIDVLQETFDDYISILNKSEELADIYNICPSIQAYELATRPIEEVEVEDFGTTISKKDLILISELSVAPSTSYRGVIKLEVEKLNGDTVITFSNLVKYHERRIYHSVLELTKRDARYEVEKTNRKRKTIKSRPDKLEPFDAESYNTILGIAKDSLEFITKYGEVIRKHSNQLLPTIALLLVFP